MESQQTCCLFLMFTWIFVIYFVPSICSGQDTPKIILDNTLFVTLKGEDLNITGTLTKPVNQSGDVLCFDPSNSQIYHYVIPANSHPSTSLMLGLKKLTLSGEYYCTYKTAKVTWVLLVRDEGYKELVDYTEFIMPVFTGVLLLFSVVGSVYVFRGDWKQKITECDETSEKPKQTRKERKEQEVEEDNTTVMTDQSTSFYASLEPRPSSIYHVLDRSAANREQEQKKDKHKSKEIQQTVAQATDHKDEGVFECVYENF